MNREKKNIVPFKAVNYGILVIAVFLIIVGFFLLDKNSLTLGPIVLVTAYCVIIPIGIMYGIGSDEKSSSK